MNEDVSPSKNDNDDLSGKSPGSGNDPDEDQTPNGKLPLICSSLWCEVDFNVKMSLV